MLPDAVLMVSGTGEVTLVNAEAERMFGYDRSQLLGKPVEALLPFAQREVHAVHRAAYVAEPRARQMGSGLALLALRSNGQEFPVEISLSPISDGSSSVLAVIRDTSERLEAQRERKRLEESERQKAEQLRLSLREAQHRIKNNLQSICDLLSLELGNSAGEPAQNRVRRSVERVQSIALVHDLLFLHEDVRTVDIREVVNRLLPMALAGVDGVEMDITVPPILLSSKKATTLALVLNELLNNAVKYGLRDGQPGRLRVALRETDEGLELQVQDNGPGLVPEFDLHASSAVGLQLVSTLVEQDLDGKLKLSSDAGLTVRVWFPW